MIEQYEATGPVMSLRQMMNRLMEDAFIMPHTSQGEPTALNLPLNVYEEGENLIVEAQLPGVKPDDIEVTIERGMLTIRAEIQGEEERRDRNYFLRERRWGVFMRRLRLPETVNPDDVETHYENGVLRLVFPKSEQAKPRRITVTGNGQQALDGNGQSATQGEGTRSSSAEPTTSTASAQPHGEGRSDRKSVV